MNPAVSTSDDQYSVEQSAKILERAAELQAESGRALSLPELEAAASEAGIDAALVRRAAGELAQAPVSAPPAPAADGGILGAPMRVVHERTVDGEVDRAMWEEAAQEIRRHFGNVGETEFASGGFTWTEDDDGREIRISVLPRRGRTLVRVEEHMGVLGASLYLGMALPLGLAGLGWIIPICIAVLDAPVLIPVFLVAWAGMAFAFARALFRNLSSQRTEELKQVADDIASRLDHAPRGLPPADE